MSLLTVEVEIEHGRMTTKEPHLLPERGRGLLTVLAAESAMESPKFSIGTGPDGLPVIRGNRGVITAALVREIEGLTS